MSLNLIIGHWRHIKTYVITLILSFISSFIRAFALCLGIITSNILTIFNTPTS